MTEYGENYLETMNRITTDQATRRAETEASTVKLMTEMMPAQKNTIRAMSPEELVDYVTNCQRSYYGNAEITALYVEIFEFTKAEIIDRIKDHRA